MKYIFSIISISFLMTISVYGSHFRNYQVENGLSHNSVWYVMQDHRGFVWFGTKDGLNRYDGKHFKIYKNNVDDPNSIGHNFIHCIKEDSQKRLLVGTRKGLYLYNEKQDNFTHIKIDEDININDIMEDRDGNIWVACHGNGLFRLSSDLKVEKHYISDGSPHSIPMNFIWTIISDNIGNLWLGTAGKGLVHFDKKNEHFTPIIDRMNLNINNQSIYSIYCDQSNCLWIGTSTNGLFKYNYINGQSSRYLEGMSSVKSIIKYSNDELIMGSDKGLILFDKKTETYQIIKEDMSDDNATDNSIFSIARDREGSFWIGTYFSGVNFFSPSTNNFLFFREISEKINQKHIISSMVEDGNGNILISTHNNNIIYKYNPTTRIIDKAFTMDYYNIQSMLRDGNKLYVSTFGRKVHVISIDNGRILEEIDVRTIEGQSIFKTSDGRILLSKEAGGCAYRDADGSLKDFKELEGISVIAITEDLSGTLWFLTHNEGLIYIKPNKEWGNISEGINDKHIAKNNLSSFLFDTKNRLWIGTKNAGILLFDPITNKVINVFNVSGGMPSNIINSILNDKDGNIWASTGKGIVRIDITTNELRTFIYAGKELQYNTKCALKSSANKLYFAGAKGFISLNPEQITLNENIPPIYITGFKIYNKDISLGDALEETNEIELEYNQTNFSFEFAALSFSFPESNHYAYILEGFDKDWNYTTDNVAQYMNIPAGKYIFKVKGTNNDGVWNNDGVSIIIIVKPPFWMNTYMIILYILIVTGIVIYSIRRYQQFLNRKNEEQQYKYQVVKEKEIYESKINFFTNIAHEIRTPLSLITAPLESIIQSKEGSPQTQKHLGTMERNTNRLLDLVNQLLDFRKIEHDMFLLNSQNHDIVKIVKKVFDQYQRDTEDVTMTLDVPKGVVMSCLDSEALYKIISNLMSNAVKFTKNQIDVKLETNNQIIFISVEDNGHGIEEDCVDRIFEPFYQVQTSNTYGNEGSGLGLSLAQSLANKLGGDIYVQSTQKEGSVFILELPIIEPKEDENSLKDENKTTKSSTDEVEIIETEDSQTILIVEDNKELRDFMKDCLEDHYTIIESENGLDALKLLDSNNFDVIISDIMMPKMDGLEFCHELKSDPAYSHIPIILLSAKTDTTTKIEGLKKGADIYMEKPFSIEQLKAQVASIIENRANVREKLRQAPLVYFKQNTNDSHENADFVERLNNFILQNMSDENFSIDSLSREFAISRTNFQKKIKSITGITPNDYIKLIRLNKSAELLSTGKYRINEVCLEVGFNTPSYFSKCFYEHFGKLPKDFIQS